LPFPGSNVALQYAGNTMPTVFEISLGAIDRGASLQFLSQYPDEGEILLPPRSYLEVVGSLSRKETDENGRVIRIVSLKANANLTSSTIEQFEVCTAALSALIHQILVLPCARCAATQFPGHCRVRTMGVIAAHHGGHCRSPWGSLPRAIGVISTCAP
jgi:hypothetical protein